MAFYLYVGSLLALCLFLASKAAHETRYHLLYSGLEKHIANLTGIADRTFFSLAIGLPLKEIRGLLRYMRNLEGTEQERLSDWILKTLPSTDAGFRVETLQRNLQKLGDIRKALLDLKGRFDWLSLDLFSLAVFVPSTGLLVILMLIDWV